MRPITNYLLPITFLTVLLAGCADVFSSRTKAELGQNAVIQRSVAEQAKAGTLTAPQMAYYLECYTRVTENLDAAARWKPVVWKTAPSTTPATLPWKPAD